MTDVQRTNAAWAIRHTYQGPRDSEPRSWLWGRSWYIHGDDDDRIGAQPQPSHMGGYITMTWGTRREAREVLRRVKASKQTEWLREFYRHVAVERVRVTVETVTAQSEQDGSQ